MNDMGYEFLINTAFLNRNDLIEYEFGKIVTPTEDNIALVMYRSDLYDIRGYHMCVNLQSIDQKPYIIGIDDVYRKIANEHMVDVFVPLVMHELGHCMNPLSYIKDNTDESIRFTRSTGVLQGVLDEREKNADAFAVSVVGKSKMINAIEYLRRQREKRPNDPAKELALKEFELRKRAISRR